MNSSEIRTVLQKIDLACHEITLELTYFLFQHPNVVTVREIVVGSNTDKIYIVMDFVEHDMKSLMETMRKKQQGQWKCYRFYHF